MALTCEGQAQEREMLISESMWVATVFKPLDSSSSGGKECAYSEKPYKGGQ